MIQPHASVPLKESQDGSNTWTPGPYMGDFGMAQSWLLHPFGEKASGWKISFLFLFSFLSRSPSSSLYKSAFQNKNKSIF